MSNTQRIFSLSYRLSRSAPAAGKDTVAVGERACIVACASGPPSNNKECAKLLAGVETEAVKKLQPSK
jgi:hypothetical protein